MRPIVTDPSDEPSNLFLTVWSRLDRARKGDPKAIEGVYKQYRRPVFLFLSRRLPPRMDAELIADEVMDTVLRPSFLAKADRSKGRFRDLLLAVTRNVMGNAVRKERAARRGGRHHSVDFDEVSHALAAPREERVDFDRFYAEEVMLGAREALREEAARRGRPDVELLEMYYDQGLTQAEIAQRTRRNIDAVNTGLDRARKRLKEHFVRLLRLVCSTPEELRDETAYLLSIYARRGQD